MAWIRIRSEQDGDLWSAYCDELGLASCGTTRDEAIANLRHAVIAFCRALDKRGILESRLAEKGIRFEPIPEIIEDTRPNKSKFGELSPVLVGQGI